MSDFDLFVIGAGSGGVRAARIAAGHGARVAVAEEHKVGGTCVIRGCVPKKLLVYGAHFAEDLDDAAMFGWDVPTKRFDWPVLRDVRLRALADSPDAFGSTLEREQSFDEKEWRRRTVRPVWVAEVGVRPVAMAGVFADDGVLQVWGMWTDPDHRGQGVARALLDRLVGPAVADGRPVALHVNTTNAGARAFYEGYGFEVTGPEFDEDGIMHVPMSRPRRP